MDFLEEYYFESDNYSLEYGVFDKKDPRYNEKWLKIEFKLKNSELDLEKFVKAFKLINLNINFSKYKDLKRIKIEKERKIKILSDKGKVLN